MENHHGILKPQKIEKAQTIVEFALVFPILLLITYGIIEFGRMLFIYTSVTGAAREAARVGATASNYKNCGEIKQAALDKTFLVPKSDVFVDIQYYRNSSLIAHCHSGYEGSDLILGDRITVRVSVPYSPIIPLPGLPESAFPIARQSTRTLLLGINIEPP